MSDAGTFASGESDTEDEEPVDHHQLKVDADVDDISSFADSNEDAMPASKNTNWHDFYLSKDPKKSVRDYFMSRFYKYLVHVEGSAHSDHQALIHGR